MNGRPVLVVPVSRDGFRVISRRSEVVVQVPREMPPEGFRWARGVGELVERRTRGEPHTLRSGRFFFSTAWLSLKSKSPGTPYINLQLVSIEETSR